MQDPHETRGQVFRDRAFAMAAASDGRLGGARCLAALRLILSGLPRARSFPTSSRCRLPTQAYDDMDRLKNPADIEALQALVRQLIDVSQRMM